MTAGVGARETGVSPHRRRRERKEFLSVTASRRRQLAPATGALEVAAQTCSRVKKDNNFIAFYQRQKGQMLEQSLAGARWRGEGRGLPSRSLPVSSVTQPLRTPACTGALQNERSWETQWAARRLRASGPARPDPPRLISVCLSFPVPWRPISGPERRFTHAAKEPGGCLVPADGRHLISS